MMLRNKPSLLLSFLFLSFQLLAQDKASYEKHWYVKGGDSLPYRLLLPKNYNAAKKYPLILFLHGSGERGSDNEAQLTHGWKLFLQDDIRTAYPAIVIFPQCAATSYWSNVKGSYDSVQKKRVFNFAADGEPTVAMTLLMAMLDDVEHRYKLDKKRLYVGGLSMGGMGTFELVRRKPKMFASAFPICGGANTTTAGKLTKPHWWIFHGEADAVVPVELSKSMAAALKEAGADVKLTTYPGVNHNSWDNAFAEPNLMRWIFSNRK